jgi:hypothetical protein
VLPITEALCTDLYEYVAAAINATASKDVFPQNTYYLDFRVASKDELR